MDVTESQTSFGFYFWIIRRIVMPVIEKVKFGLRVGIGIFLRAK